jgi:hypothetical protein
MIEDDPDTQANLRDILEMDDHRIESAGSAAEAFARKDWSTVSAIILDRRLPDATADELLPRLRLAAPDAAIIVVTGYSDLQGAISALRQGASDYILKPIDPNDLRTRLKRIAASQQAGVELKRQAELIRLLLVNASDAIIVADVHGKVLLYNPATERLIGPVKVGDPPEAWPQLGRACRSDSGDVYPLPELPLARALRQERVIDEDVFIKKSGESIGCWMSVNASPIHDEEGIKGAVVSYHDITDLKDAQERALRSERLAAIGQVVTGLAHESRNALQRSQACLEMLALKVEDRPEALDLIARIQKAQDQLHLLYEDVRGYAAPIRLERRECDLAAIWREAWTQLESQRKSRQATLLEACVVPECWLTIDPFRMEQVFRNVLENALAACPDPVVITLSCTTTQIHETPALRVVFRDNGPGFSREDRQRLFEPFYTTKTKGTGLGMAISRRIIEAHGGRIAVGDASERGAEIAITLPRSNP